jgi:Ca2+-binding RTX toxin-like protein
MAVYDLTQTELQTALKNANIDMSTARDIAQYLDISSAPENHHHGHDDDDHHGHDDDDHHGHDDDDHHGHDDDDHHGHDDDDHHGHDDDDHHDRDHDDHHGPRVLGTVRTDFETNLPIVSDAEATFLSGSNITIDTDKYRDLQLIVQTGGSTNLEVDSEPGGHSVIVATDGGPNTITLSDWGNDTVYAGGGSDTVTAGYGHDTIYGQAGDDSLIAGSNASLDGGAGNDTLTANGNYDTLAGGQATTTSTFMAANIIRSMAAPATIASRRTLAVTM